MAGRSLLFGRKLHLPAGPVRLQWDPSRCCRTGDMASPLRTLPVFSACKIAPRAVCCYGRQKTEQPKRETRKAGNAQSGKRAKQGARKAGSAQSRERAKQGARKAGNAQSRERAKRGARKAGSAQSGEQTKQEKRIKQETDKTENRKER